MGAGIGKEETMPDGDHIGTFQAEVQHIREKMREGHLNALRQFLKDADVLAGCRDVGLSFRNRILTPLVAVFHMTP